MVMFKLGHIYISLYNELYDGFRGKKNEPETETISNLK